MKIGSLFSGIGGFELGLEWAGVGHTVWQCEINPFGRRILRRHWPEAQIFEDITTLGREVEAPPVDVICGGFPCQDISVAGRQAGLEGTRSGLFYEMVRIIRSVRPRYIVLENVANIIAQRDTLNAVLSELHQSGYDGEWSIVSAANVGAPHLRKRWFFIGWRWELANANYGDMGDGSASQSAGSRFFNVPQSTRCIYQGHELGNADHLTGAALRRDSESGASCRHLADADHKRLQRFQLEPAAQASLRRQREKRHNAKTCQSLAQQWPPKPGDVQLWQAVPVDHQPAICRGVNGVSTWLANINRKQTLMALGNAIVPQCAELVGRRLLEIQRETQ